MFVSPENARRTFGGERQAGWTGMAQDGAGGPEGRMDPPRTIERKRKGRGVDVIGGQLPTPPHSRQNTLLPTPESARQPRKSPRTVRKRTISGESDTDPSQTYIIDAATGLPTPQTLPRKQRKFVAVAETADSADSTGHDASASSPTTGPPSPGGYTMFIHSAHTAQPVADKEKGCRRRPGLTFAQQMGLLNMGNPHAAGFGGRLGAGVGMGGSRTHAQRGVDSIVKLQLGAPVGSREEENPFLVKDTSGRAGQSEVGRRATDVPRMYLPSPGRMVLDSEAGGEADADGETEDEGEPSNMGSPLAKRSPLGAPVHDLAPAKRPVFLEKSPVSGSAQPALSVPPAFLSSTPTPTTPPPALGTLAPASTSRAVTPPADDARAARIKAMMDEDHNPFLSRPGDVHLPKRPSGPDEADRPFVTYVFRGSRKVFANPFGRPDAPFAPAELDLEDDAYEDHPCPKPKLLWPTQVPVVDGSGSGSGSGSGGGGRIGQGEVTRDEEVTPSPPTSPIMRTPPTRSAALSGPGKGRFLRADRSWTGDRVEPPEEVYTDSEEERERSTGQRQPQRSERSAPRAKGRNGVHDVVDVDEEEEGEPTVRRGLLFGPDATMGGHQKRPAPVGELEEGSRGFKKGRTLRI